MQLRSRHAFERCTLDATSGIAKLGVTENCSRTCNRAFRSAAVHFLMSRCHTHLCTGH